MQYLIWKVSVMVKTYLIGQYSYGGCGSKIRAATPLRSSKLKWAWRAQFLSHNLQILWKFIFFESLQMIVKPSLAISNSIEFGKKWSSPPSMCKGVLALSLTNFYIIRVNNTFDLSVWALPSVICLESLFSIPAKAWPLLSIGLLLPIYRLKSLLG